MKKKTYIVEVDEIESGDEWEIKANSLKEARRIAEKRLRDPAFCGWEIKEIGELKPMKGEPTPEKRAEAGEPVVSILEDMKKEMRDYFLIFGNPEDDPKYWERNYITLEQFIFGVTMLPIFAVWWVLKTIFGIKINLK